MKKDTIKRNILFIMTDQHRYDFIGASGGDYVRTPNLDRIARQGVRFTNCFANSPLCVPARIGLAAGQQPGRIGSLDNQSFLPASARTYYQRLRDYNYRVGCVGKLDLAKPDPWNSPGGDRPCVFTFGFTHPVECEGKWHAGVYPQPQGPYGTWLQEQGLYEKLHQDYSTRRKGYHDSVLPAEAFQDTWIGRRSVEWIENIADDGYPWHLFASFAGPHSPFDPPTEYADRWRDAEMLPAIEDSLEGKPTWHKNRLTSFEPHQITESRRQYAAYVELIDDSVGQILAALERRGMAENTYVIFASDHGEMLGDHGMYSKRIAYEPSLRVPLLVSGPDIHGGRVSDALIELIDINPTICELASLPLQENIDARSFAPILSGQTDSHRTEVISADANWRCIRTDRYKFVENRNDIAELYDLIEDPCELNNIASQQAELARELRSRMLRRFMEGAWQR